MFLSAYEKTGREALKQKVEEQWEETKKRIQVFRDIGYAPKGNLNDDTLNHL